MRTSFVVTSITLIGLHGTVHAGAPRGCANVSAQAEAPVRALLVSPASPTPDSARLIAQFRACLTSRNICGIVSKTQGDTKTLITAEATRDLPGASEQAVLLLRSIPRLRSDSNQYCLVAQRAAAAPSAQQWIVYGWVIPANAGPVLPLQKQALDNAGAVHGESLRALAAALWSFAERMSGQ
jgi:hypothetical protein